MQSTARKEREKFLWEQKKGKKDWCRFQHFNGHYIYVCAPPVIHPVMCCSARPGPAHPLIYDVVEEAIRAAGASFVVAKLRVGCIGLGTELALLTACVQRKTLAAASSGRNAPSFGLEPETAKVVLVLVLVLVPVLVLVVSGDGGDGGGGGGGGGGNGGVGVGG
ncbi:unnamed protein product [Litomosoides sigmodontis]|uniref:Uncharacterized protein n=1 Tax=Litomosoides sigmodontis TaxID=42156 RepID=A0A3P6V939_LITSI|nr:unnamed protein product [Litomosoides sigmodontis]